MQVIIKDTAQEASRYIARTIIQTVRENPRAKLGLATGSSPLEIYKTLIKDHEKNGTDYQSVKTFNLDEYVGMKRSDPHSYRHYMAANLFNHINIPEANTHMPDERYKANPEAYDQKIAALGGIDLQLLGIGLNGHIGFNEPGVQADIPTHVTRLSRSTREANARFFDTLDEVPTHAITMGIRTILSAKRIFLIATGYKKADIIRAVIRNGVQDAIPATYLKTHPDVTVVLDQKAASKLQKNDLTKSGHSS
ncbi:MAG: glucosamine-6-phosphate deaminase [Bacillota bacterium]